MKETPSDLADCREIARGFRFLEQLSSFVSVGPFVKLERFRVGGTKQ